VVKAPRSSVAGTNCGSSESPSSSGSGVVDLIDVLR